MDFLSSVLLVSLLMVSAFSPFYPAAQASSIRASTLPSNELKNPNPDQLMDQGNRSPSPSRNHFADFLRALYVPEALKDGDLMATALAMATENDTPNEILAFNGDEQDLHDQDSDYNGDQNRRDEFPTSSNAVLLPILQKRNQRYCGSYLADALQMACSTSSYLPLFGKRSTLSGKTISTTAATPKAEFGTWPFIDSQKAHSILSNQHLFHRYTRYTRGVHDECCVKGCSFKELTSYCTRSA